MLESSIFQISWRSSLISMKNVLGFSQIFSKNAATITTRNFLISISIYHDHTGDSFDFLFNFRFNFTEYLILYVLSSHRYPALSRKFTRVVGTNSREEWRVSVFQSNLRKQLENCRKSLKKTTPPLSLSNFNGMIHNQE